jgi:hypothetical protein
MRRTVARSVRIVQQEGRMAVIVAATVTGLPPGARGAVLLTGSHGGRYVGTVALAARVRAAVFHDAGLGLDESGIASLPLFDSLGVPAAAVGHETARIGDAQDMLARGRLTRVNAAARALAPTRCLCWRRQPIRPTTRRVRMKRAARSTWRAAAAP